MPKKQIRSLIGPISKEAVLLHGTAAESAIKMFEVGRLPPGTQHWRETKAYIYFVPVQDQLPVEMHSEMCCFDRKHAVESASLYAGGAGEPRYITKCVTDAGIPEAHAELIMAEWLYGERYKISKKEREIAKKLDWDAMHAEAEKRKGVVMEIDVELLEIGTEPDPESEGVRFHCPNGLSAKYVRRITPQGPAERQILREYLAKIS